MSEEVYGTLVGLQGKLGTHELVNNEYLFGRSTECDFVFTLQSVSSKHCALFPERGSDGRVSRVLVRDMSTNGTFINGVKIGKNVVKELANGDELSLGVASASVAKKTKSLADSFVAFIFKGVEEPEFDEVHAAFVDPDGPVKEFECGRTLGSGAFAEVRLCIERSTGKKYAAKIIDKQKFAMNKELRSGSYRDEINILKSIQHPYIVGVKDIFETARYLVIVLQYVDGGDLFDLVVSVKRFSEAEAKIIFLQMVEGLQYLHGRNIAHRDLKPENYLVVSKKSNVHILMADFGLARLHAGDMKTLCGTPQYLAPELVSQALGKKGGTYTQAVDVWSLAVVLYVMLSGYPPFGPKDHQDILNAKYDFNNARWKTVSQTAKELISAMLVKDGAKRLTIDQVRAHPWLEGVTVPPLPEEDEEAPALQKTASEAAPAKKASKASSAGSAKAASSSSTRAASKAAADAEEAERKVQFEVPEKERQPTQQAVASKLTKRAPTGLPKKRDRDEKDDDEEDEDRPGESQLAAMKVAELRVLCGERKLSTSGTKSELIERLCK